MKQFIEGAFTLLSVLFDKIPLLNRFKGYRTVLGFVGLGIVKILTLQGILVDPTVITTLEIGLTGFTALSLNSKGRNE